MECCRQVFDADVEDPVLRVKVRRILIISVLTAALVLISSILSFAFAVSTIYSAIISLFLALLVPACGYYGAKSKSANYISCFSWCSCLCGGFAIATIIILIYQAATLSQLYENCLEIYGDARQCTYWTSSKFYPLFVVNLIICFAEAILYCYSFYYGRILYSDPYFGMISAIQNNQVIVLGPGPNGGAVGGSVPPGYPGVVPYPGNSNPVPYYVQGTYVNIPPQYIQGQTYSSGYSPAPPADRT